MSEDQRQNMLQTAEMLANKGEFEQALTILDTMECVMASWLKGKIYLMAAEDLAKSFTFTFYASTEMKFKHSNLLKEAHNHLYKSAMLLPSASLQIQEVLNPFIWTQMIKAENEIAKNRTITQEDETSGSYDDDFSEKEYQEQNTDYVIDQMSEWTL